MSISDNFEVSSDELHRKSCFDNFQFAKSSLTTDLNQRESQHMHEDHEKFIVCMQLYEVHKR